MNAASMHRDPETRSILVPFNRKEAMTLRTAADVAGRSEGTLRNWCCTFGIGRKIGGVWQVSRVALAMYLDGDTRALTAYHGGERNSALIASYFERTGLKTHLPQNLQSQQSQQG